MVTGILHYIGFCISFSFLSPFAVIEASNSMKYEFKGELTKMVKTSMFVIWEFFVT